MDERKLDRHDKLPGAGSRISKRVTTINTAHMPRREWPRPKSAGAVPGSFPAGGIVGTGNVVIHNCFWASAADHYYDSRGGISGPDGYSVADNVVQRPRFVAASQGDFRLKTPSGCTGFGLTSPSPPGPRSLLARTADPASSHATG